MRTPAECCPALIGAAALCISAICAPGSTARANECADYSQYLRLLGKSAELVNAGETVIEGDLVYMEAAFNGLYILDVSNPTQTALVSSTDVLPGSVRGIAKSGEHVLLPTSTDELYIVDVSNVASPSVVGSVALPDQPYTVTARGTIACLAVNAAGLQIVDFSDPVNPVIVGSLLMPDRAIDVAMDDSHAYVVVDGHDLVVVDITDVTAPAITGDLELADQSLAVAVSGSVAYLANNFAGLQVVNVQDPAAPQPLGSYPTAFPLGEVAIGDGAILAVAGGGGSILFDVSNPMSPLPVAAAGVPVTGLSLASNRMFVSVSVSLESYQIDPPQSLPLLGTTALPAVPTHVTVSGNLALCSTWDAGLQIVDISDPGSANVVGDLPTPGQPGGSHVVGELLYLADGTGGLRVIDFSDPSDPHLVGFAAAPFAHDVEVANGVAWVAAAGGLKAFDLGNPYAPLPIDFPGVFDIGDARGITGSGSWLYVAHLGFGGLAIIDIANPATPVQVANLPTPDDAYSVVVHRDRAWVADFQSGVQVFNVTDPTNAFLETSIPLPGQAVDLALVDDDLLHVAIDEAGFVAIDVSDPLAPAILGGADTVSDASAVAVAGGFVVVGDLTSGLEYFPIDCNASVTATPEPTLRSVFSLRAYPNPVARSTTIRLSIPAPGQLEVSVFDVRGRRIQRLYDGHTDAGVQRVAWDAKDRHGAPVAAGVYFVRATTGVDVVTGRVVVVR